MPRATLFDYRSTDVIGNNLFSATIIDIPGAPGLDKNLELKCTGFEIPGTEQARLEVVIQGFKFYNAAGSTLFGGEFSLRYLEDSNFTINKLMRSWKEVCGGTNSGSVGGSKSDYSRDITLTAFNPRNEAVGVYTMGGCFPVALPEISLESSQSPEPMILTCRFSFDYHTLGGVTVR